MTKPSYLQILAENFPNVKVRVLGSGQNYSDLVHDGGDVIPPQVDLDTLVLQKTRSEMWLKIQAERDRRTQGGVQVGPYWFHSDQPSRIQQLGLVLFGSNLPAGIMWKTMSGSFVEMTPTLALQIFQSVAVKDQQVFAAAEQHKALMNASSTPETYDFLTSGPAWPPTFV